MNQRFLTTFSIVVIKHVQKDDTYLLGNQSFIRSQIFLSKNISPKQFQNSLFYVQVDGNNREFNQSIEFQQKIIFRHKISNKYLSYSDEFEEEQNDTTYRLELSEKKCFFKIYPCFQYQTKISSKIKFNEDVYITSQITSAKLGYISTRQMQIRSPQMSHLSSRKRTVLGLNFKSKFMLHNYYELEKQEANYTFGSIIWLTHIECSNFLAVAQPQNSNDHRQQVMFEKLEVDKDMQSIEGLWLLESDDYEVGGKLHFQKKFMLKNLFSGAYLSFSKNYKLVDNQRVYSFTLEEHPSEHSKFIFKSLKGEDNRIKKGSYLIFKNNQTNAFVGCRRKKFSDASKLTKPTIYFDFSDEDLFKIIQLSEHQSEAIRFIFSVREELKYIKRVLTGKLSRVTAEDLMPNKDNIKVNRQYLSEFGEIFSLYDNMKKELEKLSKFDKLYEQLQLELIRYIEDFTLNIRQFRKKDSCTRQISEDNSIPSLVRMTLKTLYELLRMICHQNRQNQLVFYKYIHYFIDDFFFNVGAEDLMITVFSNNYSLLCRVPDELPELGNQNIVKTIIKSITKSSVVKNQQYWLNIQKIMKLLMTFIYLNKTTIDGNQRLISQELFQNKTFDKIFFVLKIIGQKIKVQVNSTFNDDKKSITYSKNNSKPSYQESVSSRSSKPSLIDIEQIKDPLIIKIIESLFELLWSLCSNRNFISKKAINKYLNQNSKNGPQILINYLNIPVSKRLLNNLYGLITNLYIDSCPRINRAKPLGVINFVLTGNGQNSRSQIEEGNFSSRLNDQLLLKGDQSYGTRPLFISNLLSLTENFEPSLTASELDSYKNEIHSKIISNLWSVELLNSMTIMMSLESYTVDEIIEIFDLMAVKLMRADKTDEPIPIDVTIGIMNIYEEIIMFNLEMEMKKMTTYLKHKFSKSQNDILPSDVDYLLPLSKKVFGMFDSNRPNDSSQSSRLPTIFNRPQNTISTLSPILQQYNNMQDILQRLYPNTQLKQYMYELFVSCVPIDNPGKSQPFKGEGRSTAALDALFNQNPLLKMIATTDMVKSSKNVEYLQSIHKVFIKFNRPKYYFLKLLMNSIVITKDQAQTFQVLFEKYKTIKHLISISQYWLCNSQQGQGHEDAQKFFNSLDYITSYFYDGYTFESKAAFRRDYSNINVNRQLLIRNFGIHVIVLELLETNFYLLEKKKKKEISKKHLTTFEKCFQVLNHFIYECRENKQLLHENWHVINKFRDLVEVGQTALYIELFKNHKQYTKQIKPILVEKIINKIIKPIDPKTYNPHQRISVASNDDCQFNPEYFRFFKTICLVDGKCYKPNLEMIFKFVEKDHIFRRIFFAEEDKYTKKFTFCLDMYKIKADPLQIPFIYHSRILQLMNLFILQLDSVSMSLKHRLQSMFTMEYLFELMGEIDIYSNTGIRPELNFLLKKQVTKLCTFYLDKNDKFTKLYDSEKLGKLLMFINKTFAEKPQRKEFQSENEKIYILYLQKYRQEIEFYRVNQRLYYNDLIKPFLLKLKHIFEKLNNFSSNKTYQMIIYLLDNIKPENLSHQQQLETQKYNIDQVSIKWRNFVDKDLDNSKQEKFAKRTVLQLLRNPQTVAALQQQQKKFFQLIKEMSPEYYIKAINVLLEMLMQQELTENESQQTILEIYEILSTLEGLFSSFTPKEVDNMTPVFEQCSLIQHLIDYCNLASFDYNNILFKKILDRILKIFNVIMINDEQLRIHKTFYKYFQENMLSYRFFKLLNNAISQISNRVESQRFFDQVNGALNSLYLCVQQKKIHLEQEGLRFVSQLCNYNPFTSFLRFQPLYPSIDFLQKIYNSLIYILYQQKEDIKISVIVVDTAEQILRCISSFLTGGNKINQNYIIDNKFPEILNEVLKMESLKETYQKAQINQRNRLLQEVIQFYASNGIEIGNLLNKKIKIIDFRHIYILNRMKQALLRTLTECVTGNQRAFSKIKIQIPIQFLKINLIWIYEDFINSKQQLKESIILRKKESWDDVVEQKQPNSLFLMIGFYFYMLIENYNLSEKEKQQEDDDMGDDKEKNKQKVVKKFFNSISDKQKKQDQMKSLEKEPFAEEMKQFYQKYYEALEFFCKYTLTIQVNLPGGLARVYFPKIPICEKLTQPMIEKFNQEANRVSQDEKIKSLLEFSEDVYEQLQGEEEFFMHYEKNYSYLAIFLKAMKYESEFLFIAWVLAVLQTLLFLLQNYLRPNFDFATSMFIVPTNLNTTLIFIISMFNLYLAAVLIIYILSRKIPVIMNLLQKKFKEEEITEGIWKYQWLYVGTGTLSEISYIIFVIFCLIGTFVHPMFAGFMLTEILNRIQIGKQILRSIKQTWIQLLVAVALLIIINLFYAMLVYVVFYQSFSPTCTSLLQCMLFMIDSSLKSDSGFLGTDNVDLYPDEENQSLPNARFFCQVLYVVFAQKVVFEIFSGTIIDKFSELRQESVQITEDEQSQCYICGMERFIIDFEYEGFQTHIKQNHSKINYIFYIFYHKRLFRQNYGIVEKYVEECQLKRKKDWIPDDNSMVKVDKEKNEKNEEEEEGEEKIHEKYYIKKTQQLKKIRESMGNIIQDLKGEDMS